MIGFYVWSVFNFTFLSKQLQNLSVMFYIFLTVKAKTIKMDVGTICYKTKILIYSYLMLYKQTLQ